MMQVSQNLMAVVSEMKRNSSFAEEFLKRGLSADDLGVTQQDLHVIKGVLSSPSEIKMSGTIYWD